MNNFTPPNFPKFEISQLIELENYYEELVNYYEYLASIARLNLNSIKDAIALSREETILSRMPEKQLIYQMSASSDIESDEQLNGHCQPKNRALDLGSSFEELGDLAAPPQKSSQNQPDKKVLATSKRKAIQSYLQKIYPNSASIREIANAVYSKKFARHNDYQFYHNIQQTLYAHQGKLWKKASKGMFFGMSGGDRSLH